VTMLTRNDASRVPEATCSAGVTACRFRRSAHLTRGRSTTKLLVAVLHTDDNEIFTITAALQRGGREIVSVHSTEPGGNQNPRKASAQLKPEPIEERRAGRMI
jgi:hypothetical protein